MDVFGRLGRRKIVLASLLLSWLTLSSCARTPAPSAATLTPPRLPATWTPQPEVAASATPTPVLTNALSTEPPTPLAGPATASPMSGSTRPEPIALLPVGSSLNINRMQMMDADRGWAIGTGDAGADSHILRTQDGGLTWADVSPPELVSLDDAFTYRANGFFLDAQTAWVVYTPIATFGANTVAPKTIWRTQDGGLAWQPSAIWQSTAIGTTCWDDLTFVDANLGWYLFDCWQAMGSYVSELFRTLDGGNTWELIEQHGLTHHTGMRFLGREGWVSRNSHFWDGLFLVISFDQGLTW